MKEEFLLKLENALSKLEEADRKKVIRKYKSIFTRKTKQGKTGEEIISEFGNFNDLLNQILKEHNISTPTEDSVNVIAGFFKEFLNVVEDIVNYIAKKDVKEVVTLIIKIVIALLFISLLKLPILFIRDLGTGILSFVFMPLNTILIFIWRFVLEIIYVIIALTLFVKVYNIIIKPNIKSQKK